MGASLDIICVPHAGGSSAFFSYWKKLLPPEQRLVVIDLPGHGRRSSEALVQDARVAAKEVQNELEKSVRGPYVLFGHSMGAHLAYRALAAMKPESQSLCRRLLASAAKGPNVLIQEGVSLHAHLPDDEFTAHVVSLGVLRADILRNREFIRYFLPLIRADFKICETLPHYEQSPIVPVPILAIGGSDDWVMISDLIDWIGLSSEAEGFRFLPGDHFYFMGQEAEIFKMLSGEDS